MTGEEAASEPSHGRLVTRLAEELHPHPSYARHRLTVSASQLSVVANLGDRAFHEPVVITREGSIIDGYARWHIARLQHRNSIACIEYELSEEEALHLLLQRHRRSSGLNDFVRILLALELESSLKKKAQLNQRIGGQTKDSSRLTEAQRLDVRREIAAVAGVSLGNVTKVKQVMIDADPRILEALRIGEVRIHRAWSWRKMSPQAQQEALLLYRSERGVTKRVRELIARHHTSPAGTRDLNGLIEHLRAIGSDARPVHVKVIKGLGRTVILGDELVPEPA